MKKLVFATNNKNKISEARAVLDDNILDIVTLEEIGITEDIVEDGDTLEANAVIKAKYVHELKEISVFAEDTGLEIDALDGAPGVITARYAGDNRDHHENMKLVLKNMEGCKDRGAQFRAVICYIKDGQEHLVEGIVRGTIAEQIAEGGGFGYDPIFIPEGYTKTFSELDNEIKLSMSHRTRALNKLVDIL